MLRNTTKHISLCLRSSTDWQPIVQQFENGGFVIQEYDRFAEIMSAVDEALRAERAVLIIATVQHGGLALTEALRKHPDAGRIPVVLFDPEGDIRSAIRALQLGVVDYLTCDMLDEALQARVARLHAVLSGSSAAQTRERSSLTPSQLHEAVSFDAGLRAIRKGDMWISLSPIEWRLFEELLHYRGSVVSFGDLVVRGLNRETVSAIETSLLRLHMSRLRAKLQQHFGRDLNIITLRGRGYMLA